MEDHEIEESGHRCVTIITDAGHGRILRGVSRLFYGERTKRRTMWISGVANVSDDMCHDSGVQSGKSQFIRRLRRLLGSDEIGK